MITVLIVIAAVVSGTYLLGLTIGSMGNPYQGYKVAYKYKNTIKPFVLDDLIAVEKKIDTKVVGRASITSVRQPVEGRKFKEGLGESANEAV